jgi:hypothetical protein
MTTTSRRTTLAGIGLMLLSVSLFSLNDAVGKWLVKGCRSSGRRPRSSCPFSTR